MDFIGTLPRSKISNGKSQRGLTTKLRRRQPHQAQIARFLQPHGHNVRQVACNSSKRLLEANRGY